MASKINKPIEKSNGNINTENNKQSKILKQQATQATKENVPKKVSQNSNNKRKNDAEDFEPPSKVAKKKEKKVEVGDKFENMVQEYKNKLLSGNLRHNSKKWYEE